MLQDSLNNYFVFISFSIGVLAILINWIYLFAVIRGIYAYPSKYAAGSYGLYPFLFSLCMLGVLWITSDSINVILFNCFKWLTYGWGATIFLSFGLSLFAGDDNEKRISLGYVILPSIIKIVVLTAVLWLIH